LLATAGGFSEKGKYQDNRLTRTRTGLMGVFEGARQLNFTFLFESMLRNIHNLTEILETIDEGTWAVVEEGGLKRVVALPTGLKMYCRVRKSPIL
jgi:hypothetical protein